MKLRELASRIDAKIYPAVGGADPDVKLVNASDTMSGLIANASPETLLVTGLANAQLIRVAELMDAPGLCLAGASQPGAGLLELARASGLTILVSSLGLEETRRLLEECLRGVGAAQA